MRALLLSLLMTTAAHAATLPAFPSLLPEIPAEASLGARGRLLPLIQAEAARQGVPADLADAVATIETGYTENATGSSGEIGLMQVMPTTAWMLGFRGNTTDLYDAATNIHYGVTYLARALAASNGNLCRALMKYRAGTGSEGYSPLSILYCRHATTALTRYGSPLAAMVAATTPAAPDLVDTYTVAAGAGGRSLHPNLALFAAVMGDAGVQVEKPVAAWHISRTSGPGGGHVRVQAVMDIMRDDDTGNDPHVVHVPTGDDSAGD
jgi:hypothetical protein